MELTKLKFVHKKLNRIALKSNNCCDNKTSSSSDNLCYKNLVIFFSFPFVKNVSIWKKVVDAKWGCVTNSNCHTLIIALIFIQIQKLNCHYTCTVKIFLDAFFWRCGLNEIRCWRSPAQKRVAFCNQKAKLYAWVIFLSATENLWNSENPPTKEGNKVTFRLC